MQAYQDVKRRWGQEVDRAERAEALLAECRAVLRPLFEALHAVPEWTREDIALSIQAKQLFAKLDAGKEQQR